MRFSNVQFLEKEQITVSIHNLNASKAIIDGQVVAAISYDALNTNSLASPPTSDLQSLGVDVMTMNDAAGSTTNSAGLIIGIAKVNPTSATVNPGQLPVGGVAEAVVYGFTDAIVQLRTRATSTDVWATTAALAAGDILIPETVNNALASSGTAALGVARQRFYIAQSRAISITYASSTGTINPNVSAASATVETMRLKVRVCCM